MRCLSALGAFVLLSLAIGDALAAGRWSRQLTDESVGVGDWIPVDPQGVPDKRQVAEPRVLNHPAPFQQNYNEYRPQEARQLYLQSVPASQFVSRQNEPPQYNPLAFVAQPNYNNVLYSPFAQLNNQFYSQAKKQEPILKPKPSELPRYVDGYKVENSSSAEFVLKKKPAVAPVKKQEVQKQQKVTERSSVTPTRAPLTTIEKEEVQLLYVPLETLQGDKYYKNLPKQEIIRDSVGSPGQINNQLYTPTTPNYRHQNQLKSIQQELMQQAYNAQALQGKFKQNPYDRQPLPTYKSSASVSYPFTQSLFPTPTITTPKSKKLKAHQPPLAIYMVHKSQEKVKLSDVLSVLKDAKDISVLDNIGSNTPKVFVGPSNLRAPNYYAKFELPYLSGIDGNRIQRNVDRLPFFVAPLSYKAPEGFAKIPFPAPHVGSVIVNPFMDDDYRAASVTNTSPNSFSYSSFQSPSTESFRTTVGASQPSSVSYFPSATPNPVLTHQSTLSNYQSSYSPFEQAFNTFRQPTPSRNPEPVVSTSPRQPSYYPTTPSKPTVSYYSFSGPEYSTTQTSPKPPSTSNYNYRGHYITNAANEGRPSPIQLVSSPKDVSSERPKSTPVPPAFQSHNAYSINHAFEASPQETPDVKNVKANEINAYKPEKEKPVYSTQYADSQRPVENNQFSSVNDYSPLSYFGPSSSSRPNALEESSKYNEPSKLSDNKEVNYSPVPYPVGDDDLDNLQYQTEPIDKDTTYTTTTTTTTAAPTTRATVTRRPIHSRGRPRYTTQKPDSDVVRSTTTRRTPVRERKPNTFRTRYESPKTTTEASATEVPSFESGKKRTETTKTNRYSAQRNRPSEDESYTSTESSLPKTSAANRNQRLRSRGKTQFKTSDNYEGSDIQAKKSKNNEGSDSSLAYQRDVLHQNYPVTLTEKPSTADARSSTPTPIDQAAELTSGKIKIYETTGSTAKPSESPLEYYDNQPVFQGESQKYLTDSFYEGTSERGGTIMPELYFNSKDSSTESSFSSTAGEAQKVSTESYDVGTEIVKEQVKEQEVVAPVEELTEKPVDPTTAETPVARFRNKLRSRPKFLLASSATKDSENGISIDTRKKVEEATESAPAFTRRSSVQAITYRPPFDRQRTTMRIEEIEAELKSSRQQHRSDHSTTLKYPVYIPQSTASPAVEESNTETTTKRNHFVRRRPVRPTVASATPASRSRTTTEAAVSSEAAVKRVKTRGRIRSRPTTTEKPEEAADTTEKVVPQKYTTRGRLATQKYFKKPSTEKPVQESVEDQVVYDSINRPEYVEFKINNDKTDYNDFNPENGKAESHWSPKLTYNSFRPIFNPNLIAEEMKQEGIEYGTKLPTTDSEESEIITARNPYDDMFISVTPATTKSSSFYDQLFPSTTIKAKEEEKGSAAASTFESVLEEVMRNLEQQDEDEYAGNYDGPVVKQEVGEIGQIPPENEAVDEFEHEMKLVSDLRKVENFAQLEDENFDNDPSVDLENKLTTTTERQARRRGVWRKIKVRPVSKNSFDTAESQYYGSSSNDLLKNDKPSKTSESTKEIKEVKEKVEVTTEEVIETTAMPTDIPEVESVTEFFKIIDEVTTIKEENIPSADETVENKTEKEEEFITTTDKTIEEEENSNAQSEINITERMDDFSIDADDMKSNDTKVESEQMKSSGIPANHKPESNDNKQGVIWDPKNIIGTSMSTEVSHETEICYRGRCIKTKKLDLKKP